MSGIEKKEIISRSKFERKAIVPIVAPDKSVSKTHDKLYHPSHEGIHTMSRTDTPVRKAHKNPLKTDAAVIAAGIIKTIFPKERSFEKISLFVPILIPTENISMYNAYSDITPKSSTCSAENTNIPQKTPPKRLKSASQTNLLHPFPYCF